MATALIDLYGGKRLEPFDRVILAEGYRPSDAEEFMCPAQRAYFLRKLKAWKESIIEESRATILRVVRDLEEQGQIVLERAGDDFVD